MNLVTWLRNKVFGKELLQLWVELTQAKDDVYKAKKAWGEEYRYRQQVIDALYKERVDARKLRTEFERMLETWKH